VLNHPLVPRARTVGLALCCSLSLAALVAGTGAAAAADGRQSAAAAATTNVSGDFDGDGRVDLAVGAPGANRVRVSYTHVHPGGSSVQNLHSALPSRYPMRFGTALAVGDFNGDGRSDLAVSAPSYATPPGEDGVLETRGAVFLYLGSSSGLRAQPLKLIGPYDGDDPFELGTDLAAADVDGDGRTDLAVTLWGADDGNIRVYHGSSSGLSASGYQELDDYDATALAFGDVNGDHHPELIAASTVDLANPTDQNYGDLMIFHGTATGLQPGGAQKIRGDQVGVFSDLGTAVAAGDINGDGYADVVAGAAYDRYEPGHPSAGSIVVLTGSHAGLSPSRHQTINEHAVYGGSADGNGFGSALAVAKITGDRYADVVVGAPTERVGGVHEAGAVYLLKGSAHGLSLSSARRLTAGTAGVPGSVSTGAHFGAAVFSTRLNSDAYSDLVIGAPDKSYGATHGGMYVTVRGTKTGVTTSKAKGVGSTVSHAELGTSIR
jgi:hypothetical protein